MGSFNLECAITKQPIIPGEKAVVFIISTQTINKHVYEPTFYTCGMKAEYYDYGYFDFEENVVELPHIKYLIDNRRAMPDSDPITDDHSLCCALQNGAVTLGRDTGSMRTYEMMAIKQGVYDALLQYREKGFFGDRIDVFVKTVEECFEAIKLRRQHLDLLRTEIDRAAGTELGDLLEEWRKAHEAYTNSYTLNDRYFTEFTDVNGDYNEENRFPNPGELTRLYMTMKHLRLPVVASGCASQEYTTFTRAMIMNNLQIAGVNNAGNEVKIEEVKYEAVLIGEDDPEYEYEKMLEHLAVQGTVGTGNVLCQRCPVNHVDFTFTNYFEE